MPLLYVTALSVCGLYCAISYTHVCAMYGSDVLPSYFLLNFSLHAQICPIKGKRCDVVITCAASRLRKFELVM